MKKRTRQLRKFIMNRKTGVLHRFPASESCNLDAIPRGSRFYFSRELAGRESELYRHLCWRCFKIMAGA